MRKCTTCNIKKSISEFHKCKGRKDGIKAECKECRNHANREYLKTYDRKDNYHDVCRDWRQANNDKVLAASRRRRVVIKRNTPPWADMEAIDFAYFSAKAIRDHFGGVCPHVDHIIPLAGTLASGLHVADNLQLISASQNAEKGRNLSAI